MVPAEQEGPLFHWTRRKGSNRSSIIVTTRAPENTRSSNDGDGSGGGGCGSDGSNGSSIYGRTSPPSLLCLDNLTHALSHFRSLRFCETLSSSVQPLSLAYVLESPNRPSCVACTLVTRRRCPAWVSAAPLRVVPHSFSSFFIFFNL